jgi:hypothetical protein
MNIDSIIMWLLARLEERSTWIGVIGMLSSIGVTVSPQNASLIATIGVALSGGIMAFTKDHNVAGAVEKALQAAERAEAAANTVTASLAPPVPDTPPAQV